MPKIAIIGTTGWGTTLAVVLARKGMYVRLWARRPEEAEELNRERQNRAFLPGIEFPRRLSVTGSLEEALADTVMAILAVPAQTMRANSRRIGPYLADSTLVVSAAKGLEMDTGKRMSQVIAEEIAPGTLARICVMSGPNLSREIAAGLPAATVVAAAGEAEAEQAQHWLTTRNLCVYANGDVVGVELGGALKNIIAVGAGMGDGLGYGDNAKAAFVTRGLSEITRLGVALGANPLTFLGLAGIGDLITTCASPLSRNHYIGVEMARGRPLAEILASMRSVAEGVPTVAAAYRLSQALGVDMPITRQIYRVLYEGLSPRQAVAELMGQRAGRELVGID